jgi:hypothetical protein
MFDAQLVSNGHPAGATAATPLRWPPPGLESMQGAAWRALMLLTAGTAVMTAPLLLSVATPQSFWSAGLFGSSWWMPITAALCGLLLVLFAVDRITRILSAGMQAVRHGHDWWTVAYVACDARHDAGFLLQGHRQYATLDERERRMLLSVRVTAVVAYALALLWVVGSFSAGVILAGRGIIPSGGSLALLVLGPGSVLLGIGMLAHGIEANATRALARTWRKDDTRERRLVDEIGDWRADRATRLTELPGAARRILPTRLLAVCLIALAALLPLPVLTLAVASAMGPALAHLSVPRYEAAAARFAKAALLAPYALPATGSMTALEAGEMLHAVASIGTTRTRSAIEREPVRRYAPWPEPLPPATLPQLQSFGTQLLPRAASLTPAEVAHLEAITAHPALADFALLARAPLADVAGGRWQSEQFGNASVFELPVARFGGIRHAAQLQVARAVLELYRGQPVTAETSLREVVSVGLLIGRESPTMIDLMVGNSIALSGAAALETFYRTIGRTGEADAMRRQNEGVDRVEEYARALQYDGDTDSGLRRSMAIVANDALPRGLRWESLLSIQIGAGCLNPHTVVFGHGAQYAAWLDQARASLVRYPTEQALFDLTLRGTMLPHELRPRADIIERVLGLTLGRTRTTGACAALLTGLSALD